MNSPEAAEVNARSDNPFLTAALAYAARGCPVLPLHSAKNGRCTCGKPACNSPAKHPTTERGLSDATTDSETIRAWWQQRQNANVGILTGAPSGLVVLDVDPRHGGDRTLEALEQEHGKLPETTTQATGGGGRHILFVHPGGRIKSGVGKLGPGLDVKADGAYIVVAPSVHKSGSRYVWNPATKDAGIAPLPEWLLEKLKEPAPRGASPAAGDTIPEGDRNTSLTSLGGSMRRRGMTEEEILPALVAVNARRCTPPLAEEEVRQIAKSVSQYDPAEKPRSRALENVPLTSDLILGLADLISCHVFFKDKRLSLLIAVWSLASYVYDIFTFFGYLWINSPVKRCGKSLLEDMLSHICCRATPRLSNVSESSIFRLANEGHTLILDELETLRGEDREKYGMVMSILNSGFQSGGKVPRVEKSKRGFQVVYYNAFCPKVLAGIRHLADTIEDRSFKIAMVRKTKAEKVERFNLRKQAGELAALREEMEVWAEARRGDVETIYDGIGEIRELAEADDRFKDIAEPLLAIASFADAEAADGQKRLLPILLPILLNLANERGESERRESISAFVPVAEEVLAEEEKVFIRSDDLLERVRQIEELASIGSTTALGNFLRKFDLSPRRASGGKFRGYMVTRDWVEEVKSRYFFIPPDPLTRHTCHKTTSNAA